MDGRDPYLVWNQLDDNYMPLEGGGGQLPPPNPDRLLGVLYAFGTYSFRTDARLAGAKFPGDQEKLREQQKREREERMERVLQGRA